MARSQVLSARKQLLFCPGPVNFAASVKEALVRYEIGHREIEFSAILRHLASQLLRIYGQTDNRTYEAVIVTGSGTAANETLLSSVLRKGTALVISNGEFGERLFDIAHMHYKDTKHLKFGWGEKFNLQKIRTAVQTLKPAYIAVVHHETSTGMLNPIVEIGTIAKKIKAQFLVDTVSSGGAEIIDIKKAQVTFCTGSAAKALASIPGASYVIGKRTVFEALADVPPRTTYLNLYKFYTFLKDFHQTPNTPAVQTFIALDQAVTNITTRGISTVHKQLKERARLMRQGLKKLGFTFLLADKDMSVVLTTVNKLPHLEVEELIKKLRDYGIIVYRGKGPLASKVFQVATIGEITKTDIDYFLTTMRTIVKTKPSLSPESSVTL